MQKKIMFWRYKKDEKQSFKQVICIFAEKFVVMTENIPRWEQKLQSYHKALNRLAEVVAEAKKRQLNDFEVDVMIGDFPEIVGKLVFS